MSACKASCKIVTLAALALSNAKSTCMARQGRHHPALAADGSTPADQSIHRRRNAQRASRSTATATLCASYMGAFYML